MKKNVKRLTEKTILILSILFCLWFVLSYAEIMIKNLNDNPNYGNHNFIVNFVEMIDK